MKNQMFWRPPLDPEHVEAAQSWGIPSWQASFLLQRGFDGQGTLADLDGKRELPSPWDLPGMREAVWSIRHVLESGGRVRVYGDYDADGVTATAVLVRGLRWLGYESQVDWYIPNRFDEGYGLNVEAVWRAHQDGIPLLVTVDCGSSSPEAADLARSLGVGLVITDHHALPDRHPKADALVNPELMAEPDRVSGAGVALQLVRALGEGEAVPALLYGLAALGTVADVVPLKGTNRALVTKGLDAIQAGLVPGLTVMFGAEGREIGRASSTDLAYFAGPRLNAAGRMGSAEAACELLLSDAIEELRPLADRLMALNRERRDVEQKILAEAWTRIPRDHAGRIYDFPVIAGEGWHQGVIGIVASRFREWLRRPVAVVAWNGGEGKGSARGVPGFNLIAHLRGAPELFSKLGGHPGAAGFSLPKRDARELSERLSQGFPAKARQDQYRGYRYDLSFEAEAIPDDLIDQVRSLEPYGQAFEAPRFLIRGTIKTSRTMGADGKHLSFELTQHGIRAVGFGLGWQKPALPSGAAVRFLASLETNWYQGRSSPQWRVDVLEGEPPRVSVDVRRGLPEPLPERIIWVVDSDRAVSEWALKLGAGAYRASRPLGELLAMEEEARRGLLTQLVVSQWRPWPRLPGWADAVVWRCSPRNLTKWEEAAWLLRDLSGAWIASPKSPGSERKRRRLSVNRERLVRHWRAWQAGAPGLIPGRAIFQELEMDPKTVRPGERRRLESSYVMRRALQEIEQDREPNGLD